MRVLPTCLTAVILIASFSGQSPARAANDENAIREIVRKYMDARERQDPRALEALFTSDADQLVSSGEWRKAAAMSCKALWAARKTWPASALSTVRFLSSDVAIADGRYEITGLRNDQTRRMWTTLVLTRMSDGWRIAAIRNMLPAPPPPPK